MPRLRPHIALCAFIAAGAVSACTTSDLGLEAQLSLAAAGTDDPLLPDEVNLTPTFAPAADRDVAVASIQAQEGQAQEAPAQAAQAQEESAVTLTAYAASAPSDRASDVLTAKRAIAARSPELDALIAKYADHHDIPLELLRRVVNRESTFNPAARNGPYWGLMQILPQTARTMGYSGSPEGLLDAETNLLYAGKYLRGAYITAGGDHDLAVRFYSRGYYYDAKRRGLLVETGLRPARTRMASQSL